METRRVNAGGSTPRGTRWSVGVELPAPKDTGAAEFYSELEGRLIGRAEAEGIGITGRTVVTAEGGELYSLYVELIFTDPAGEREVSVLRLCDTRLGGLFLPIPKRLKRRGCLGFCLVGDRALAFLPRSLDGAKSIRQRDTYKYFDEIWADYGVSPFSFFCKEERKLR